MPLVLERELQPQALLAAKELHWKHQRLLVEVVLQKEQQLELVQLEAQLPKAFVVIGHSRQLQPHPGLQAPIHPK